MSAGACWRAVWPQRAVRRICRVSKERIWYSAGMTKQGLEILLEHVATWPEEAQEELVQLVAEIEKRHFGVYRLNDEERAAVRRGLREMREGKLASDEEVAAVFGRYRA
jgi:hypothetical protein